MSLGEKNMDDSVSVPRSTTNLPRDEGDRITVIFTSAIKKKKKKNQHFQRELGLFIGLL